MSSQFPLAAEVTVRFADTDALGHCNNSNYFTFMEQGRLSFIKKIMPDVSISDSFEAFPFILADIQCSFKAPSFTDDKLGIHVGLGGFGTKSFIFEYEIFNQSTGALIATGKSVQVMFDYKSNSTYPVPDDFKQKIENYFKSVSKS